MLFLAAFRRCFSAPESARLFMFRHGGLCAMLILSLPHAGELDVLCSPATPLLSCKLQLLGCLDPFSKRDYSNCGLSTFAYCLFLRLLIGSLCNEAQVAVVHCRCKFYWSCMNPESWIFLSATCWLSGYSLVLIPNHFSVRRWKLCADSCK